MSEDDESKPHIIIDNGSKYIKAGFAGEEGPSSVLPACVGYPKYSPGIIGGINEDYYIGQDAENKNGVLKLNYPIENRIINNWDDMEKIWAHIFVEELRVAPEEHNVLIDDIQTNPIKNKEKMAEIMFETFNVQGFYIVKQCQLSLYSQGKHDGLVVDSGYRITQIVPIMDGYLIPHTDLNILLGGRDLTIYMIELLKETGYRFSIINEDEIAKSIKEKACYVSLDFEDELKYIEPFDYELPDGTHVIIKDERIRCPEVLFYPSLIGNTGKGLGESCYDSINKCDIDMRKVLYSTVILSGGNSMFNGLIERLTKELKALSPESMKEEVKVIASPERKYAIWIGGSILSNISTFDVMWITKNEYEESGSNIVHKKLL